MYLATPQAGPFQLRLPSGSGSFAMDKTDELRYGLVYVAQPIIRGAGVCIVLSKALLLRIRL